MTPSVPIRPACPPGVCICERDALLARDDADLRIFKLTRQAEKELLQRLEDIHDLDELHHLQRRMHEQLGIRLDIEPGFNEVRTMRGIAIRLADQPGLCRKNPSGDPRRHTASLGEAPGNSLSPARRSRPVARYLNRCAIP